MSPRNTAGSVERAQASLEAAKRSEDEARAALVAAEKGRENVEPDLASVRAAAEAVELAAATVRAAERQRVAAEMTLAAAVRRAKELELESLAEPADAAAARSTLVAFAAAGLELRRRHKLELEAHDAKVVATVEVQSRAARRAEALAVELGTTTQLAPLPAGYVGAVAGVVAWDSVPHNPNDRAALRAHVRAIAEALGTSTHFDESEFPLEAQREALLDGTFRAVRDELGAGKQAAQAAGAVAWDLVQKKRVLATMSPREAREAAATWKLDPTVLVELERDRAASGRIEA